MTFETKNEIYEQIPEILNLYLNTENINNNYINYKIIQKKILKKIYENQKGGNVAKNLSSNQNLISLEYEIPIV